MKVLYKNKTKYTKETYAKYLQFHQNKFGTKYRFITILIILLLCFFIITNFKYANKTTGFILLLALLVFCLYRFFQPINLVKKELKTEKFEKEKEFTFKFYEKYFTISDSNNFEKIKYWKLYKIYETNDFFYLYINKDHAFLLEKNTFTKGDISTFYIFVKRKRKFNNFPFLHYFFHNDLRRYILIFDLHTHIINKMCIVVKKSLTIN